MLFAKLSFSSESLLGESSAEGLGTLGGKPGLLQSLGLSRIQSQPTWQRTMIPPTAVKVNLNLCNLQGSTWPPIQQWWWQYFYFCRGINVNALSNVILCHAF